MIPIAFDIETSGDLREYALQPFRATQGTGRITSAAWAWGQSQTNGALNPSLERLAKLLRTSAEQGRTIVCWNTSFDVAWLIASGLRDEVFACQWADAMLMLRHLEVQPEFCGKQAFGLKPTVARYLPEHAGYEQDVDFFDESPEARAKLLQYNKDDARHTLTLCRMFWDRLTQQQRRAVMIESKCIPMVAEAMVEGIRIDHGAAVTLDNKLEDAAKIAFVKLKLSNPEVNPELLASPKQLSDLLYLQWNLPAIKLTETGGMSTDKEALAELARKDPRAKLVHEYREASGNRTKFAANTLASLEYNGDGHTRPAPRIYGTYTGRMTYASKQGKGKDERQTGIALHQWKRDPEFRKLIVPPEGYELLEFDFAGQEFRWMAVIANDPVMLDLCRPGEDAHSYMGARIAGIPYRQLIADVEGKVAGAKDKRQLGKVANLSLQYRTSAGKLRVVARTNYGLDMEESEAQAIHATYQLAYKQVPTYWKKQRYLAARDGYVSTVAGRRVQLPNTHWQDNGWSMQSTSINFPIQGTGADQKYLALAVLRNYLPKVDGRFYFELHDGLFVVVPKGNADRAVPEIASLLSNLPYKKAWGVDLPIQFPVDAKRGPSWGELKEVKL